MKERMYLVREESLGWTVSLASKAIAKPFTRREQAIAAASSAVAASRAKGWYAWIKVMHSEELQTSHVSFAENESRVANRPPRIRE